MHSLSDSLTQRWSQKKRALVLGLESDSLEMASGGENMMDYVVLHTQQYTDPWKEMCTVWGNVTHIQPEKKMHVDGWDNHRLHSPPS